MGGYFTGRGNNQTTRPRRRHRPAGHAARALLRPRLRLRADAGHRAPLYPPDGARSRREHGRARARLVVLGRLLLAREHRQGRRGAGPRRLHLRHGDGVRRLADDPRVVRRPPRRPRRSRRVRRLLRDRPGVHLVLYAVAPAAPPTPASCNSSGASGSSPPCRSSRCSSVPLPAARRSLRSGSPPSPSTTSAPR